MTNHPTIRRMMAGLIDGLSLPFALAAGLSVVLQTSRIVGIACLALAVAGSVTMTAGGYMTGKEYDRDEKKPFKAALAIGSGYLAGGLMVSVPYFFLSPPFHALAVVSCIILPALAVSGHFDNVLNGSKGWLGAIRVLISGAAAAATALGVAQLFR